MAGEPPAAPIPAWIEQLPKAELHLHLEGSATPETLVALAQENHGLPAQAGRRLPLEEARRRFVYKDFLGFLLAFKWVSDQLRAPADYAFLLRALLARLRRQNVLYAEITLALGVVLWKRQNPDAVFAALCQVLQERQEKHPVEVRWIFDAVRNFGPSHVARVAEYALRWKEVRDSGLVGFGIGGDEQGAPPELFRSSFEKVRAAGLRVTVHAGETAGPESIWGALRALGAERVGHGLAAFLDPALVEHLQRERIPLECCPTSNLRTGALRQHCGADDLAKHPLVDYVRAGVPVTLNTDDPGLFDCTLGGEYALAHRLGLSRQELTRVAQTAFEFAFCDEATRTRLLRQFNSVAASLPPSS